MCAHVCATLQDMFWGAGASLQACPTESAVIHDPPSKNPD